MLYLVTIQRLDEKYNYFSKQVKLYTEREITRGDVRRAFGIGGVRMPGNYRITSMQVDAKGRPVFGGLSTADVQLIGKQVVFAKKAGMKLNPDLLPA